MNTKLEITASSPWRFGKKTPGGAGTVRYMYMISNADVLSVTCRENRRTRRNFNNFEALCRDTLLPFSARVRIRLPRAPDHQHPMGGAHSRNTQTERSQRELPVRRPPNAFRPRMRRLCVYYHGGYRRIHQDASKPALPDLLRALADCGAQRESSLGRSPQIRCYNCQGIFTTAQMGALQHVRCPYCSTINGVPAGASPLAQLQAAAAGSSGGESSTASRERQEQLLRRLQAREITPLELLILREFVQHLQDNPRAGASTHDIDHHTVRSRRTALVPPRPL